MSVGAVTRQASTVEHVEDLLCCTRERLQLFDPGGHDDRRDGRIEGVLAGRRQSAKVGTDRYRPQVSLPFTQAALTHRAGEDPREDLHHQRQS
jgi:hypothetical protein